MRRAVAKEWRSVCQPIAGNGMCQRFCERSSESLLSDGSVEDDGGGGLVDPDVGRRHLGAGGAA